MDREGIMLWGAAKMKFADATPLERGYRYYHGLRTAALAGALARAENLSVRHEELYIGAFLHDVGKADYPGEGHGPRGQELIEAEIAHLFAPAELKLVGSIVKSHYARHQDSALPLEALLVQDADAIDHFGSNAVWLAFHWAKHQGRTQAETMQFYHKEDRAWRERALGGLNFALSRNEMLYRLERIEHFFSHWAKEETGLLTLPHGLT